MADIEINDVVPRNRYVSGGGELDFDYTYPILDADHLVVTETDPDDLDNPVTLVRGSDYSVTGVGLEAGGTVVLDVTAYPTGATDDFIYTIVREVPYERLNDYQFSGDFEASDVNNDFDLIVMMTQQLKRLMNAAVKLKDTDVLTSLPLKVETTANRIGRALIFNSTGDGLEAGPDAADIAGAQANAAAAAASAVDAQTAETNAETAQAAAEAAASGMKWRPSVKAGTTGNISLSGAQTIDGISIVAGDRVLVKDQSAPAQNGVYVAASGAWSRAADADTWLELVAQCVSIEEGTVNADFSYICTVNQGGTIGVTAVTWTTLKINLVDGSVTLPKLATALSSFVTAAPSYVVASGTLAIPSWATKAVVDLKAAGGGGASDTNGNAASNSTCTDGTTTITANGGSGGIASFGGNVNANAHGGASNGNLANSTGGGSPGGLGISRNSGGTYDHGGMGGFGGRVLHQYTGLTPGGNLTFSIGAAGTGTTTNGTAQNGAPAIAEVKFYP